MAYKGKKRRRIVFNVKFLFPLLFSTILLDIIVHSITLWGIINVSTTKQDFIANMISNIITFFGIAYILIKCLQYLLDLNKRKWVYVLSPMPIDINQKYLEVLYSLTPTLLVLAEKNDDPKDPKSVYLYDITKNTYTYFQKVVQLKK
ncbi:hypothetical protein ABE099_20005 [Paenibacillus turicensis]|uniref:hypothetical protein n=1 Tax=Paenibacillus turicensis TaxID=160487 RepID=UPI003D2D17A4